MKVKEIMTKPIDCLSPETSLKDAAKTMLAHHFGFLPVKSNGHLTGVVTSHDIAIHGIAKGLDPKTPLDQVMSKNVVTVHENDDVTTAANIMEEKKVRRLVVLDQHEEIAGVVSLNDIAIKWMKVV